MVAPQTVNLSSFDFGSSSLPTSTKKILKKFQKFLAVTKICCIFVTKLKYYGDVAGGSYALDC